MLPRICRREVYSCSSIQVVISSSTVRRYAGPPRSRAETICTAWAPAMIARIASRAVCTPPGTASEHPTFSERIASQPGRLHAARIFHPSSRRRPVERGNDGDVYCLLDPRDLRQVLLRTQRKLAGARKVGKGLAERLGVDVHVVDSGPLLLEDLLLEERVHHDGGGARLLQPLHRVQAVPHRPGAPPQRGGPAEPPGRPGR